jgi:hypothetical protein
MFIYCPPSLGDTKPLTGMFFPARRNLTFHFRFPVAADHGPPLGAWATSLQRLNAASMAAFGWKNVWFRKGWF